jgi:integrase/recombinase XerD
VQSALEAMREKADGAPVKPATVNMYVAAVKSLLGFAHRVGFTRFNAAPLIKLKKAPRQVAQRILGELEVRKLIDAANPGRDRLMLEVGLEVIGKGDKVRQVLIPVVIAGRLLASRADAWHPPRCSSPFATPATP